MRKKSAKKDILLGKIFAHRRINFSDLDYF